MLFKSEQERTTISVLSAGAWPVFEKGQDTSTLFMAHKARVMQKSRGTDSVIIKCKRNSENLDEMEFWKETIA